MYIITDIVNDLKRRKNIKNESVHFGPAQTSLI